MKKFLIGIDAALAKSFRATSSLPPSANDGHRKGRILNNTSMIQDEGGSGSGSPMGRSAV